MKKSVLSAAIALILSFSLVSTSCIGSFSLTNKLLSWNNTVGNKFVNELVFFAFWVLPVYEVSSLADILVLNSIEFWSGDNPVAQNTEEMIEGTDGHQYLVATDPCGYTITDTENGEQVRFDFDADQQSWSVTVDDETYPVITFVDDTHVALPSTDGTMTTVELSDNGLMAYRHTAMSALMADAK